MKKSILLSIAFLGLAHLGIISAHKHCDPCTNLPKAPQPQEGFVFVPDTVVNDQFVPAANIFYRLQGKSKNCNPTIVFLHYLEGSSRAFLCQQAAFSKCYKTLAIDLRGRGNSDKTDPSTFNYTNQAMANDLHTVLATLGITGPIVMVASVSGGFVLLKYFELFNEASSPLFDPNRLISKAVFINSGPGLTTVPDCAVSPTCSPDGTTCCVTSYPSMCPPCVAPGNPCCLCWQFPSITTTGICALAPIFLNPIGYNALACSFAQSVFSEPCQDQVQAAQLAFAEDFLKTTGAIQLSLYTNALAEDLRGVIPAFNTANIPTLIVVGPLSIGTPSGASDYLHANITSSVLATFAGKSEQPQITDFVNFNTLMADFLTNDIHPESIVVTNPNCCVCPLYVPTAPVPCPVVATQETEKFAKVIKQVRKVK